MVCNGPNGLSTATSDNASKQRVWTHIAHVNDGASAYLYQDGSA